MATDLGVRLKAARERLGLSRSEVARRAEVDAAMLFRIENSDRAVPTFAVIVRLARVVQADLNWLALAFPRTDSEVLAILSRDEKVKRAIIRAHGALETAIASFPSEPAAPSTKKES